MNSHQSSRRLASAILPGFLLLLIGGVLGLGLAGPVRATTAPAGPEAQTALLSLASAPAPAATTMARPEEQETEPAEIGDITFAVDVNEANEPVGAGFLFTKGITEVHVIFSYNGMSPDLTWERVWRLNEREVARTAGPWSGPASGRFDYYINNSGRPLPAGDWVLELYVEGQLKSLGVFIIEEEPVYPLAYTRCDGNHHNIYVSDTRGTAEQLLVTRGAGPSWSANGGLIFFFGEEGVDRQVRAGREYVFDGLSSGLVAARTSPLPASAEQLNLFQSSAWKQGSARWANVSPDGAMVAFDANPSGDFRIYFLGTDTNQQFRFELPGEQADWSPDSQQIVYRSGRDGKTGLWISNRDDTGHRLLTNGGTDSFPAWSPDGRTIVFSRDQGGNVDIYAVDVDGSNLRRLTETPGHDTLPAYTPDGRIIFRSTRAGSWGIWKMNGDGTDPVEIIPDACVGNDWAYSRLDVRPY